MKRVLVTLYNILPVKFKNSLGRSPLLKPIRDLVLRSNGVYRETEVYVKKNYLDYTAAFNFFASYKVASKAARKGIENTILRNSITLLREKGKTENDAIILDIGANFGYLSLVWANTIAKNGKVIGFEPNRHVFNSFSKSIRSNNLESSIQLYNLAVGKEEDKIELFMNSTSSNTIKMKGRNNYKTTVDMVLIDYFMKKNNMLHCDLIKIDVDGIELDILNGAKEFINDCKPILIVETNSDIKIIHFFNEISYRILDMQLNEYQPDSALPANIFCIPKTN